MIKVNAICLVILMYSCLIGCSINKSNTAVNDGSDTAIVKTAKLSIVEKLKENAHLPVQKRIALYHQLKKDSPNTYNFANEDEFTMYGYSFLWAGNVTEAIEIFKLIVAEFPNSANPYDSLAEAYLQAGNKELSLINYQKSIALNPDNFAAEDQIELIKFPDRKPEKPAEKFGKQFTATQYKADLDKLGATLLKVHSNPLKFISREAFLKIVEEKKALITEQTTYGNFAWHCSEIIASVNCSHTSMGNFFPENEMLPLSLRFPLQTRWVNDQLFVIDPLSNENIVSIKDEIVSINGIAVSKIIRDIYRHISSQGYIETTKKHFFNKWATGIIPYALGFPDAYTIAIKGKPEPVVLNKAKSF